MGCAALAALVICLNPSKSQAQVGQAHFKAWDRYERGQSPTKRRVAARRPKAKSKAVLTRVSPPVARTPIAEVISTTTKLISQILPHPDGCPRRLFCGCGASIEVFGRPIRHLFLAANWLKFPPAQPAAGMVAARRGHVMVIRQYLGNNKALVYDANSGGGRTRLHIRSLAGFSIRNPGA